MKKILLMVLLVNTMLQVRAQENKNILDQETFSFEKGDWWIKNKNAWSITNEKFSTGTKSLKFELNESQDSPNVVQIHSPWVRNGQNLILPKGKYIIKIKFFVPESSAKGVSVFVKDDDSFINNRFKFKRNMPRNTWHELSNSFELKHDLNGKIVISSSKDYDGFGSYYIDDISIHPVVD